MKSNKIYVYLQGHDFKYDISALIKVFYTDSEIIFIEEKALVDNQGLLIESILNSDDNTAFSSLSKDGQVVAESIKDINKIDIKDNDTKKIIKAATKQSIFEVLHKTNDIKVPWGVLTGIRPTKIVHSLLDNKIDEDTIRYILVNEYRVDLEKANLIINIAITERKFIYPLDERKYSLYISIPFCPTRCLYCSFPSNAIDKSSDLVNIYTEKLMHEIEKVFEIMQDKIIDTVYIGGGTPTAIPVKNLDNIIKKVYSVFGSNLREFTVEAGRPDTITLEMLEMLKSNNIKRISINPQTMNQDTLRTIGREHKSQEILDSFRLAKQLGFNIINMDLIVGLPGEDKTHIENTMRYIEELKPENLTVHTMAVKRTSRLKEDIDKYSLTSQNSIEEMLNVTKHYAEKMGMKPYYMYRQKQILGNFENVGYSTDGNECIYNMLIMEEKQTIIAVGAGGVSKVYFPQEDRLERIPNVKDLREYINRVDEMIEKRKIF
ncbi:oxygen-independent coproporphyrinogen-III oxidase 2 [Gottschalkia acidurici 9a]|uniref:Oxygen-independent coproporphyrinogen-III oxidase 2 n=1 Tax=Gottschalkia acidurici (strain ATCC 7906 / DSM 604 / BCRC 14475 / CIP 104303 / KCTC 5404 / NCIMB 10678 / 9a) TaxID=1128398 RepID=K0AY76_GOTA9|nr:coproporphyrinogen dehydrogenase HemZ [Gottschalkia acidurici]AFS78738.1 oxygen-independent coproporphyrinogen-III oxidase 2 [Gottschalkia acidurici 9a]